MAVSYGRVIFAGGIFIFFSNVAYAILRGEGDAKRAMYAMMFGAILNIIIDPIFIYTLGYGVTGAAYATILSMFLSSLILAVLPFHVYQLSHSSPLTMGHFFMVLCLYLFIKFRQNSYYAFALAISTIH